MRLPFLLPPALQLTCSSAAAAGIVSEEARRNKIERWVTLEHMLEHVRSKGTEAEERAAAGA